PPGVKTVDRLGQVIRVLNGSIGDLQNDLARRPVAALQNTLEHGAMIPWHSGDMPGMNVQKQGSHPSLTGCVENMQGADEPIQINNRVLIQGDGVRRAGRNSLTARIERFELRPITERLPVRIAQRFK